jgi:carboxymethylenebutenolidase
MTEPIAVPYFAAQPSGPTEGRPGLVVVMEGNGMSQQLLRVSQRFAAEGYVVVAPDLFHRFGGSDVDRSMTEGWYGKMTVEDGLADVATSIAHLRSLGVRSVGITGFCMGGMYAYLAATRDLDVQASVGFYGMIADKLGQPACPTLHFFGGLDPYIPMSAVEQVQAHHPDDVIVYADADHGFMRDGSPAYHPVHAPEAWDRTLAFFAEHL